jgi:arabinofuranan 3-O-arabinosyltransferase
MLIVVFCVLYFRYLDAKSENRLDEGIDPPWMNDAAESPAPAQSG